MKLNKKIVGIAASGRKESNSGRLLDIALNELASRGFVIERISLSDYKIEPCRGCRACEKTGHCIIEDDMNILYPIVTGADALVFATPIYFYSIPGHAKSFIDRFQPFWARRYLLGQHPINKGVGAIISIGGSGGKKVHDSVQLTLRYFYDAIGFETFRPLQFSNWDGNPDELPDAFPETFTTKTLEYAKEFGIFLSNRNGGAHENR